jgi:DUF4097 and DUF4098 domain-containing protein YvlB
MRSLLRLAPALLCASACSISSDHDGFSIEIGTGILGARHHATETRRLELDLAAGDLLSIEGLQGDVTVKASDEEPQGLVCVLGADGRSREEAEQALRDVVIDTRREGRTLAFVLEAPPREAESGRFPSQPRSDLTVTVPNGIEVRIASASGDIDVAGPLGPIHAETHFGGVTLARIEGDGSAQTDSGSIEIRAAEGGHLTAETSFGDVTLESIRSEEAVRAESRSGDLALRDVRARTIEAHSSFGSIRLEAVEGDVTAKTDSGDVELDGALRGMHQLHSGFGDVEVVRAQGKIDVSSNSGDVTVRDCAGGVKAESGFGTVQIEGVLTTLSAESSSGDIAVEVRHGSAAESDWRIVSRFGSVSLCVPEAFACDVDASTDFGDVEADFELTRARRSDGASASCRLGSGGPHVELHTSSGDVSLRRTDG